VDPETPSGNGTAADPLYVSGQLPWSPFPAVSPVTTTIYARPGGDDASGDGTPARPYRTFARAVLAVPRTIEAGLRFIVDVTGLGTEILPKDWAMPPIVNDGDLVEIPDHSFIFAAPLTIRAYPQLALVPADAQVGAANAAVVSTVGPGLCKVTLGVGSRAAWAGGALKGKQVVRSAGSYAAACCIFDSTPTELFLCNTPTALNGGTGPLVLASGETLDVVEPSATLMAPPSNRPRRHGDSILFTISGNMNFQGIAMSCTVPNAGYGGPGIVEAAQAFLELCVVDELDIYGGGNIQAGLFSTTCTGYVSSLLAALTPQRSYWSALGSSRGFTVMGGLASVNNQWRTTVFDNCKPLAPAYGVAGPGIAGAMALVSCWFRNSQGDAVSLISPTRLDMTNCQIDDATGDAIKMNGPTQAVLTGVTGSGNAGYGVVTDDGAHVQVDATVTVGNADGRAFANGAAAPVAAWPGAPFNNTDAVTLSRIFER
jgi:hypothetical protein